jgi:hypothetical protein
MEKAVKCIYQIRIIKLMAAKEKLKDKPYNYEKGENADGISR